MKRKKKKSFISCLKKGEENYSFVAHYLFYVLKEGRETLVSEINLFLQPTIG